MTSSLANISHYIHQHVLYLNNNKFFAGIIMILLNVGSKFISVQFSRSAEEYMKLAIGKQLLVFAMAWMGTRDIYTALVLTAVFVILSENLFNEESPYCVVPQRYRILNQLMDQNNDGTVTEQELKDAEMILAKAKQQKEKKKQKEAFLMFHEYTNKYN